MNSITTDSGGELSEGSKVHVQWHDLEIYAARLVATSDDKQMLLKKMEKTISEQNRSTAGDSKKKKEASRKRQLDADLLGEIRDAKECKQQKEIAVLKAENAALKTKLKKYQKLDGFLKRAESLVEALELQKNKSTDRCSESLGDELLENDVSHLQPAMVEQQIHSHSLGIVEEHVPDIHVRVEEGVENQSPISLRKPLMPSSASNGETLWQLEPESGIFAEKGVLCSLEHFGKSATGVARARLNTVFTPQALVSCSVKGNRAKSAHRPCEQRPPLHPGALQAILSYTRAFSAKKGVDFNEKVVLLSIGTKLSELRSEKAKRQM
ncbi:uncharacterized protein LOC125941760 [Dermacentor silvarum]|uniref:uncharacterized protein LOC125941760 n=1 Tax=Dermacentor silvarum TaxID=543639 RepID=UPI002100916F|nr:uncharacterized protein LOC125941760 [Dermacentor silvarum]